MFVKQNIKWSKDINKNKKLKKGKYHVKVKPKKKNHTCVFLNLQKLSHGYTHYSLKKISYDI